MSKAFVFVTCDAGKENSILANLKNIETVKEAYGTLGSYDLITKLEASTAEKIQNSLTREIRKLNNIRATMTLLAQDEESPFSKKVDEQAKKVLYEHQAQAYVIIQCKKEDEETIIQNLVNIPEIIEGNKVIGSYEIICKVVAPSYKEISQVVTKKIRKIQGVRTTITLNVVNQ